MFRRFVEAVERIAAALERGNELAQTRSDVLFDMNAEAIAQHREVLDYVAQKQADASKAGEALLHVAKRMVGERADALPPLPFLDRKKTQ